jgi:hypothetical protein
MTIVERLGGRKFLLALLVILVLLAVLLIAALTGRLETGLAGVIIGAVTWVLTQFGILNSSITKAALVAGKAEGNEADKLAAMPASDVLTYSGSAGAVDNEIVAGADRLDARIGGAVQQLRNRHVDSGGAPTGNQGGTR